MRKETTLQEIEAMFEELDRESKTSSVSKKKHLSIGNIVFCMTILFLIFVSFNIYLDKKEGRIPDVFGYQIYRVETGSMIPTFPIDSLIVSKIPKNKEDIHVNDIITFDHEGSIITHRIVKIENDENGIPYYITKGDNPDNSIDPWNTYFEQINAVFKVKLPF